MARIIYPKSRRRRVIYQIRHLLGMFRRQMTKLIPV
jgi:hypothetical protein